MSTDIFHHFQKNPACIQLCEHISIPPESKIKRKQRCNVLHGVFSHCIHTNQIIDMIILYKM